MNHLLAVVSASITGISLGIAIHHKQSLVVPIPQHISQEQNSSHYFPLSPPDQHLQGSPQIPATNNMASSHLENKINQLLVQQDSMRSQQSELNRELNAIQFRLDTHSASFRPLQSERNTEVLRNNVNSQPLTPLLPPRQ